MNAEPNSYLLLTFSGLHYMMNQFKGNKVVNEKGIIDEFAHIYAPSNAHFNALIKNEEGFHPLKALTPLSWRIPESNR
ncbi:MAG: hypothetical protein EOP48_15580 [Sphingobacteriales bacterium]|nr:MAG: hypothetical protein EOP48_15580 [Sphingobacteriales bacterium]